MSNKRNGIFSGVVPVMGKFQTVVPLATCSILQQTISQSLAETDPTTRHSTGSTLLDSFVGDAAADAFALQTQLTSLSFELKRIANPNIRRVSPPRKQAAKPLEKRPVNRQAGANSVPNRQVAKPVQAARPISNRHQTPDSSKPTPAADAQAIGAQIARAQAEKAQIERVRIRSTRAASASSVKSAAPQKATAPSRLPLPIPQATSQKAALQKAALQKKVYGGADYKALQSRAQAGGLVNLDDWLLFGGADDGSSASRASAKQPQADSYLSSYLGEQLQDFTASPIPGGFHSTAHVMHSGSAGGRDRQTVLSIQDFKLEDLTMRELIANGAVGSAVESITTLQHQAIDSDVASQAIYKANDTDKSVELDELSKQISYLNRRIEYLSQKLATLSNDDAVGDDDAGVLMSAIAKEDSRRSHSPVGRTKGPSPIVLSMDALTFGESASSSEKRVATLEALSKAL